jgi:hypothetical protein
MNSRRTSRVVPWLHWGGPLSETGELYFKLSFPIRALVDCNGFFLSFLKVFSNAQVDFNNAEFTALLHTTLINPEVHVIACAKAWYHYRQVTEREFFPASQLKCIAIMPIRIW